MKPSRNDPCPCGSGRKYKACCLGRDEARRHARTVMGEETFGEVESRVAEAARGAARWEADVVPVAIRLEDDRDATPALAIVTAAGYVLYGDTLSHRPVGSAARAQALVRAVTSGAQVTGVFPEALRVRDAAIADAARDELAQRGIRVESGPMPELDEALDGAVEHMTGSAAAAVVAVPLTWRETEAGDAAVADFHRAAAAFHRAAPWEDMGDDESLLLWFPGEKGAWAVTVMGQSGVTFGLALYSEPADLAAMLNQEIPESPDFPLALKGLALSFTFDRASELPRTLRREVTTAGWEVAGPDAYPTLIALRAPERRVTPAHVHRATLAIRAVLAADGLPPDGEPWTDPDTGVRMAWMFEDEGDDEDLFLMRAPQRLSPIGPAGPGAEPRAMLAPPAERTARVEVEEPARLERFLAWNAAAARSRAAAEREARVAGMWTDFLGSADLPAGAVTEFDIRTFVYKITAVVDPLPKHMARHFTGTMRRLFTFLATEEGIRYPTADAVLDDLDEMVAEMGTDAREALARLGTVALPDLIRRVQFHMVDVPGTREGWLREVEDVWDLRVELHRRWLLWYDEVVAGGIDLPDDVMGVLVGRQRAWENTPHPGYGGRTPKQVIQDSEG